MVPYCTADQSASGKYINDADSRLRMPLVCPDGPRILETQTGDIDRSRGVWWNLFNTGWSTNF